MALAVPVAAQDRIDATSGPIARAITREAVRLAAARQQNQSSGAGWSQVQKIAPGNDILITRRNEPAAVRLFVAATASELTVLNLTDPALSAAAKRLVKQVAAEHSDVFTSGKRDSFGANGARVGPDGVFVDGEHVTDLGQIIETVVPTNVVEIKNAPRTRAWPGGVVGGIGGAHWG